MAVLVIPDPRPEATPLIAPALHLCSTPQPMLPVEPDFHVRPRHEQPPDEAIALIQATVEALVGRRPPASLDPYILTAIRDQVRARPTLRGMWLASLHCQCRGRLIEATIRVADRRRSRALALRVEWRGRRWRVTALEVVC